MSAPDYLVQFRRKPSLQFAFSIELQVLFYARIYFGVVGTSYLNCNDGCFFSRRYLRRCMQRKEIIKTDLRFHIREE